MRAAERTADEASRAQLLLNSQIARNEAERNKPVPTLTIRALLAWSGFWAVVMYLAGWMAS